MIWVLIIPNMTSITDGGASKTANEDLTGQPVLHFRSLGTSGGRKDRKQDTQGQ